jgi:hypothetical protein
MMTMALILLMVTTRTTMKQSVVNFDVGAAEPLNPTNNM